MTLPPELAAFGSSVRVPELRDVRLTGRFRRVIDGPEVQRLRQVRQLGPTHLVYPGAMHTRFEHVLGTFGIMQRALVSLLRYTPFADAASEEDLLTGLAAALLHDVGHYPFAHNLEAIHGASDDRADTPRHEALTAATLLGPLGDRLRSELGVDPERVARLIAVPHGRQLGSVDSILASALSSGLDVDKFDYLERDSVHLGVPYGRSFDQPRLLEALQLDESERKVAVGARGKVPAEMFVFSRYMMFSEVYWHHTVRAVSAMVQFALGEAVRVARPGADFGGFLLATSDDGFLDWIARQVAPASAGARVLEALQGGHRRLHKRLVTYSRAYAEPDKRAAYERIYAADGPALEGIRARVTEVLGQAVGVQLEHGDVLIDTPPRDKDHPEPIDVVFGEVRGRRTYALSELSSVVAGVSTDFVKVVKKIRIFVAPGVAERLRPLGPGGCLAGDRAALEDRVLEAVLT